MKSRVSFYTFGCRLNQSETASLQNNFETNGYEVVDFNESADIVVVNTCTVTENGDADTRRLVNKINRLNPRAAIALIGCQAQTQKEKLAALPNVKLIVGNARKMELVDILQEMELTEIPRVIAPAIPKKSFTIPFEGADRNHTRANLKIQDGCNFFCTFCEIPFARGRARSRVFEDIALEASALAAAGHKELILTGINLGTYSFEGKTILDVVEKLEKIDGLERIRISSIEPTTVSFEIVERMGKTKLCRYLHLPLQSGSDDILNLMERKYTTFGFSEFILKAKEKVPELCIGTDVIVGFPGESEKHFEETLNFLHHLPLSYFHVFSYSDRTFNKSRHFENKIPIEIIQKRSQILRDLSLQKRELFMKELLGTTQKVLFEENKNGFWTGLTDHYVRVNVKTNLNLHNQLCSVQLEKVEEQNISGHLS